jgi:type 1 glutamine amidotransferase
LLLAGGAAWLGAGAMAGAMAPQAKGATKKVLFFTKSSGFQHSVITRKGGQPAHAEKILSDIGKEHGFEVTASKDGKLFEPDQIGEWDVFVFETTGDLSTPGTDKTNPISPAGEKALYEALRGGKGFMGMHCAADTFGHFGDRNKGAEDPYIQMIGGEFVTHGDQQESTIAIADPEFPGIAKGFGESGKSFTITDEWYALKHLPDDLHVILYQVTEGMKGGMYQRPNFPMTWARAYGKGRVFYTSMGHREDVWANPMYQSLLLGALGWASGRVDANIEPNFRKVTPKGNELRNAKP